MNRLNVEVINEASPYCVKESSRDGYYDFVSDSGVQFSVGFDLDDLFFHHEAYQLIIANVNHKSSPRDEKVRETILLIVEEFFRENNVTVLYICESSDGKRKMRSRLFKYWFSTFIDKAQFSMYSTSIVDEEGVDNFFAIISRNDNPHLGEAISEFSTTVQLLSSKPESNAPGA